MRLGVKNIHQKFTGEAEAVNSQLKLLIEVCFCQGQPPMTELQESLSC